MSFNILRTCTFLQHIKQLGKKYPSIKKDYEHFLANYVLIFLQEFPLAKIATK